MGPVNGNAYKDGLRTRSNLTDEQIEEGWIQHQRLCREQKDLIQQDRAICEIGEAMMRLPELIMFRMSTSGFVEPTSNYFRREYAKVVHLPYRDDLQLYAPCVSQCWSIMLRMYEAQVRLRIFECGELSWRFFDWCKDDTKAFTRTLSQVSTFRLQMVMGTDDKRHELNGEYDECDRFFQNGRFRSILSCLNDLEHVEITGQLADYYYLNINTVFTDRYVWPRLTSVKLRGFETLEEELYLFLKTHNGILRNLHLDEMHLLSGQWPSLVSWMQSSLQLEDVFPSRPAQRFTSIILCTSP